MSGTLLLALLVGGLVTLAGCLLAAWAGRRFAFLDHPDTALKPHRRAVPPVGGFGIFLGLHTALLVSGEFDAGLAAATGLVLGVGFADDRVGLGAAVRLATALAAGGLLVAASAVPQNATTVLLTVLLVVVAMNAVNLFDGLDGLVGAAALVAGLGLWAFATARGVDGGYGLIVAACLAAFLVLNWEPARIFLGDAGAYVVGVALAYGILVVTPAASPLQTVTAASVLGVFVWDLAVTVVRRARAGGSLLRGDRGHMYDRLHDRGWSAPRVAAAAAATQVVLVAVAVTLDTAAAPLPAAVGMTGVAIALLLGAAAAGFLEGDRP